jgi:hypothetical protein
MFAEIVVFLTVMRIIWMAFAIDAEYEQAREHDHR